jgi:hypothetical protein
MSRDSEKIKINPEDFYLNKYHILNVPHPIPTAQHMFV